MSIFTAAELKKFEQQYTDGIASGDILAAVQNKKEKFSEATLRKYVQLGLLPRSRRVGKKGRHQGSSGSYPVSVLRLINEIKEGLDRGHSLDALQHGRVGLSGELSATSRHADDFFAKLNGAVQAADESARGGLQKQLREQKNRWQECLKSWRGFVEEIQKAQA